MLMLSVLGVTHYRGGDGVMRRNRAQVVVSGIQIVRRQTVVPRVLCPVSKDAIVAPTPPSHLRPTDAANILEGGGRACEVRDRRSADFGPRPPRNTSRESWSIRCFVLPCTSGRALDPHRWLEQAALPRLHRCEGPRPCDSRLPEV